MFIVSKANVKYKQWLKLKDSRGRKQANQFLIEGFRELSRALQAQIEIKSFIFQQSVFESQQSFVQRHFAGYLTEHNCFVLADALFKQLSLRENPDGIMGIANVWDSKLSEFALRDKGLYVLVESLEKPGNLGAIMRSAEATHVDAMFIADPHVDIFNPNVIRASQGAVFGLPVFWGSSSEIFNLLNAQKINIIATTPGAKRLFWDFYMRETCVICIGNEAKGLSSLWWEQAPPLAIPMFGGSADSLNAGVSAALCLYEARRQRR